MVSNRRGKSAMCFASDERGEKTIHFLSPQRKKIILLPGAFHRSICILLTVARMMLFINCGTVEVLRWPA
jgi:hypothetical protein